MSRDGSYIGPFADDEYRFRLGWGELALLQEACNAGPYVILDKLLTLQCRVEEIASVIRCGLIGGGMEPVLAAKKVRTYVEARPPNENLVLAQRVLGAGIFGAVDEDDVGKKAEAENQEGETLHSPTENSDSPPSTELEPS